MELGMSLTLCAVSGLSVLLGVTMGVLTLVHRRLTGDVRWRYVRCSQAVTALVHVMAAVGAMLVGVWHSEEIPKLCQAGGFLMLLGLLESVWMLLVSSLSLLVLLRYRSTAPSSLRRRWSLPILLLSLVLKAVILAMLVFLALTKVGLLEPGAVTRSRSAVTRSCEVLRLYGDSSWQYSLVVLLVAWFAIIPATIISLCNFFTHRSRGLCRSCPRDLCHGRSSGLCTSKNIQSSTDKFTRWVALSNLCSALLWIIAVMIVTVIVFSGNDLVSAENVAIATGYTISLTLLLVGLVMVVILLVTNRGHPDKSDMKNKVETLRVAPTSLVSLVKILAQKDGVNRYQVQWFDHQRALISGVMKVYQPTSVSRWRSEVNAVAKVTASNHPSIATYLWETSKNHFTRAICTLTGDLHSPQSSVICMQHYPHGTLGDYLKTHSHITEVGLHKVTIDVARGLGFIHQHHLVHNGLTTDTIYMAQASETTGLRAVIGDFECSYEVSANTLRKSPLMMERSQTLDSCTFGSLYSISQQLDLDNNKFAPDIRSFGMIVLEMLMTLGDFDEHSVMGIHYRSRDACRNRGYDKTSLSSLRSQPIIRQQVLSRHGVTKHMGSDSNLHRDHYHDKNPDVHIYQNGHKSDDSHHHGNNSDDNHHHGKECECSPRITDVRAVRSKSTGNTPIHIVQLHQPPEQLHPEQHQVTHESAFETVNSHNNSKGKLRSISDIQNRDLPPLPPRKSPRRYRSTIQRHEMTRCENLAEVREQGAPVAVSPLSLSVHDLSDSHSSYNCASPASDQDFHSIGSLGSFETIYEDDEHKCHRGLFQVQNSSLPRSGRHIVAKPPVLKRKTADFDQLKKRYSVTSANESVFSLDSGIGSYVSDGSSDTYGHQSLRDIQRGRKGISSPDMASMLRMHKQPCSKHHPEPSHVCSSNSRSCHSHADYHYPDQGYNQSNYTDSSTTDTMSSDEPTYEKITSLMGSKQKAAARRSGKAVFVDGSRASNKDAIPGPHPAIRQQYRYAVPRLGVSAVLKRRLSDTSLSSLTSCSTHRSHDLPTSPDIVKATILPGSRPRSATILPGSRPRSATNCRSLNYSPDREIPSLSSSILSIIQDSNTLLDNPPIALLQSTATKHKPSATTHQRSETTHQRSETTHQRSETTDKSKQLSKDPEQTVNYHKTGLNTANPQQRRSSTATGRCQAKAADLQHISKMLDGVNIGSREKGRMLNMLKLIGGNDRLGMIGQQLMTLFSDCWLEDPMPSADELFQRLSLVLPSASV